MTNDTVRPTMKLALALYLVVIHLVVGAAVLKTDIVARVRARLGYPVVTDELTPHYHTMVSFHRRLDPHIPVESVVFVGDSLTQGLAVSAVTARAMNLGIGTDTTVGVLARIPHSRAIARSVLTVVAVGLNDLGRRENTEIIDNYQRVGDAIPPDVPILFSAVLPVDEVVSGRTGENGRIRALNRELRELCARESRLHYLDASARLVDTEGNLADEYHIGDGVHLSPAGNEIWITALREPVRRLSAPAERAGQQ